MTYESKQTICVICSNVCENETLVHNLTVEDDEGNILKPLDLLLKYTDAQIPKSSLCCVDCELKLKNFAILEKSYFNLKKELLDGFKTQRTFPKRKGLTTKVLQDETVEDGATVDILEVSDEKFEKASQNFDARLELFNEYLALVKTQHHSKCVFARIVECKTWCLSKHCSLEIKFELNTSSGQYPSSLKMTTTGQKSLHEYDDGNRIIFELTKNEFAEECYCEFCCKKFENDEELNQHHKSLNETAYKCPNCPLETKCFQARNSHFLTKHTESSPYQCSNCLKTFKTKYKKSQHERPCSNNTRFQCKSCFKYFTSKKNLNEHQKHIHEKHKYEAPYKCPHCPKKFHKKCNYDSHIIAHEDTKPFICTHRDCGLAFKRARALKTHQELKHDSNKKYYLCAQCGQEFESLSGYNQHCAKHTGIPYIKRKYQCKHCDKTFRSPADVAIHEVVHTKTKAFNCDRCNAQFSQKASLKDHYHVHLKTFQCDFCQKAFGRKRYLLNHIKSCTANGSAAGATGTNDKVKKEETISVLHLNTLNQEHNLQGISYMVTETQTTLSSNMI